ncbi:patatin-like phospholipase family protein [Robiginitalea sp. M366]|uniref:patatin-like phospholipase family protein n=1 Tax=Robiginitalea aestuariiviva TaxID=3036903 RepID=UPI00240E26FC|nr:patatin-like phospholipase family protein [Robiginitalea aestuariiviva]MDG1571456.1 patatin-like phospholipase family protein [Robiginitalea aestuariiviva]
MELPEMNKVGLVLSGGGVRGMAHIGALHALREFDIQPHWVSGSSVGALVGALYASGTDTRQMLQFFKETPIFRYNFFSFSKPGLMDTERYQGLFSKYWPENRFDALQRPLFVAATNLQKGEERFFYEGELIRPLLASAALPPVFSPVAIEGELYADGGIMNNFPLEPIRTQVDYVIGSNVSVITEISKKEISSSIQLTNRTTGLMMYAINREKIHSCDLVFEPMELEKIGVLDKKGIEEAYQIGYDHAARKLEALGRQTS